ncbi:Hypothetical protein A7982_00232 [Minicystis rosea]|nr:Hypothetical protein A7982_00232 [Minicystis rosea]
MKAMMKKLFLAACSSLAIGATGCLAGSDQGIDENVAEAEEALVTPSAFSGEASILDGTLAGITPPTFPVALAGPQPPAGGTFTNSILNFSLAGISLGAGNTSTVGTVASGASNSQSQLASLSVGITVPIVGTQLNVLSAGVVQAQASATRTQASLQPTIVGTSSIANLSLLGTPSTSRACPTRRSP